MFLADEVKMSVIMYCLVILTLTRQEILHQYKSKMGEKRNRLQIDRCWNNEHKMIFTRFLNGKKHLTCKWLSSKPLCKPLHQSLSLQQLLLPPFLAANLI